MTRDWGHPNITDSKGQRFLGNQHKDCETMLQEQTPAISWPLCMSSSDPPGIQKPKKKQCYKSKKHKQSQLRPFVILLLCIACPCCFLLNILKMPDFHPMIVFSHTSPQMQKWRKCSFPTPALKHLWQLFLLVFSMFTFAAGGFRRPVWGPCRRFTPTHTGGCSHAEEIDGVRLQPLQQIFGAVLGYLHRGDSVVRSCPIGKSVCRQPTAAHLGGQRLPVHLDICRAVAF